MVTAAAARHVRARPVPADAAAASWELVERAQAGDTEAFAAIYCRYRATIFRFVFYRVGNRPIAEDLTADTFERALKRISSFTWQGRDLGAWLVTIARNLVADHYKAGATRNMVAWGRPVELPPVGSNEEPAEDEAVARMLHLQRSGVLAAAMRARLTEQQRTVLELRFWAGLTVLETAAKLGIAEGACKATQYRAVRALAKDPAVQALLAGLVPS